MTLWLQIAMNVAVLAALVFALVAALVVPLRKHRGRTFEDGRSLERGPSDPRKNVTPSV
jgi:hypothetical protein